MYLFKLLYLIRIIKHFKKKQTNISLKKNYLIFYHELQYKLQIIIIKYLRDTNTIFY